MQSSWEIAHWGPNSHSFCPVYATAEAMPVESSLEDSVLLPIVFELYLSRISKLNLCSSRLRLEP